MKKLQTTVAAFIAFLQKIKNIPNSKANSYCGLKQTSSIYNKFFKYVDAK